MWFTPDIKKKKKSTNVHGLLPVVFRQEPGPRAPESCLCGKIISWGGVVDLTGWDSSSVWKTSALLSLVCLVNIRQEGHIILKAMCLEAVGLLPWLDLEVTCG